MGQELVHVYLMPGMAASSSIFENIKLPMDKFKLHPLEWVMPLYKEPIGDYALRMSEYIKHENAVLLGVSFGGVIVQEISKHIKVKRLIIVSSVKTKYELPKRMQLAKLTKAYKLLPTLLASNIEVLTKYAFGKPVTKRLELYKKYLSLRDRKYLDWAIAQMVCWNQKKALPNTVHIHGDKDGVFPIKNINHCIKVKGGTHIMIINKFKWFNANLPDIIMKD